MTSRERLLCALNGDTPDRVPYCEVGVSGRVYHALVADRVRVEAGGIDEMDSRDPVLEMAISRILNRDNVCYRATPSVPAERIVGADGIAFYADGPVKSRDDLDRIELPDPDGDAVWGEAPAFLAATEGRARCLVTRVGISAAYLAMGMETFSIALYEDRALVEAVLERYAEWSTRIVRHAARLGFDMIWTADDVAYKTGLLMSPAMFSDIVMPYVRRVADAIEIPWVYHSDGDMTELLPDLVDVGVSAFNPIEPEAMDIAAVRNRYGTALCLIGNVSVHTLAAGTEAEVRETVRHLLQDVAPPGAFALASGNSLASYCKPENVRAMLDTLARYGQYPIASSRKR